MKLALFGISEIKVGKHNLKDPRLDQADKKTHAQVEVIGDDQLLDADAILASQETKADLILKDLEFVETRLGRDPQPAERAALEKIRALLEGEKFLFNPDWARRISRRWPRTISSSLSDLENTTLSDSI